MRAAAGEGVGLTPAVDMPLGRKWRPRQTAPSACPTVDRGGGGVDGMVGNGQGTSVDPFISGHGVRRAVFLARRAARVASQCTRPGRAANADVCTKHGDARQSAGQWSGAPAAHTASRERATEALHGPVSDERRTFQPAAAIDFTESTCCIKRW